MQTPCSILLVGPMGAGKSSVGRALAQRLDWPFVDIDEAVERQEGRTIASIFERDGEAAFRALERTVLCELLAGPPRVVATGGGAVLDDGSRRLMRERAHVVYLQVPVDVQLQRLEHDRARPLLQRPDREAALLALAAARNPLYEDVAHVQVDATCGDADAIAAMLAARLVPLHPTQDIPA